MVPTDTTLTAAFLTYQRMVSAGYMGKKSGKGFYDYGVGKEDKPVLIPGQNEGGAEGESVETPAPYGESEMKA